jgi:hypothetical protein
MQLGCARKSFDARFLCTAPVTAGAVFFVFSDFAGELSEIFTENQSLHLPLLLAVGRSD